MITTDLTINDYKIAQTKQYFYQRLLKMMSILLTSASFFARSKPKIAPKTGSDNPYMVILPWFVAGLNTRTILVQYMAKIIIN